MDVRGGLYHDAGNETAEMRLEALRASIAGLYELASASHAPANPGARVLAEAEAVFRRLNDTEAEHLAHALANDRFPFDAAQAALSVSLREFAQAARTLRDVHARALSDTERARLEELSFLAERAPLVRSASLPGMRAIYDGSLARRDALTTT